MLIYTFNVSILGIVSLSSRVGLTQERRRLHEGHQDRWLAHAARMVAFQHVSGAKLRPDRRHREAARTDCSPAESTRPTAAGARIGAESAPVRADGDRFPAEAAGPSGCRAKRARGRSN